MQLWKGKIMAREFIGQSHKTIESVNNGPNKWATYVNNYIQIIYLVLPCFGNHSVENLCSKKICIATALMSEGILGEAIYLLITAKLTIDWQ